MKKAFVRWGGTVAVLAVAGLVLTTDSGVPLLPGRPPTTSDSSPSGGPTADAGAPNIAVVILNSEGYDLSSQAGPEDYTTGADLRAPDDFSEYLDTDVDSELGSEPDGPISLTQGTLASVVLALMVLRASRGQNRDRRQHAAAPASVA